MDEATAGFQKLSLGRRYVGFADDSVNEPIKPYPTDTPRYLFRIFSAKSAGENNSQWVKSEDARDGHFTDIFTRDDQDNVAIALNEHLRWMSHKSRGDPFTSWTTSLVFALQHAIYKRNTESTGLEEIHLCIIDTTKYPNGTFRQDLDLISAFQDKVNDEHPTLCHPQRTNWGTRGLGNLYALRHKMHKTWSGYFYFGEYLSQGQVDLKGRCYIVSCDRVINHHLFQLMPGFKANYLDEGDPEWANAVVRLREPFYADYQPGATEPADLQAAETISCQFEAPWRLPMLLNLLALRPCRADDPAIISHVSRIIHNDNAHRASLKARVVANDSIPEVQLFSKIVNAINKSEEVRWVEDIQRQINTPEVAAQSVNRNSDPQHIDITTIKFDSKQLDALKAIERRLDEIVVSIRGSEKQVDELCDRLQTVVGRHSVDDDELTEITGIVKERFNAEIVRFEEASALKNAVPVVVLGGAGVFEGEV
ncbi:Uu.00g073840.m01.CDS01 [Anthostomella pinea]|uniref:Uu.00g073840.m01.CDS01 n=1 Tax=Anthostomella pinea TaxID=933095 RepID=A0AAI8VW38_9PEZI|nr:Uu.00g073840.m01.CDS01 [Anthostomella pinea]